MSRWSDTTPQDLTTTQRTALFNMATDSDSQSQTENPHVPSVPNGKAVVRESALEPTKKIWNS